MWHLKNRGKPKPPPKNIEELLSYESFWYFCLHGLRDGKGEGKSITHQPILLVHSHADSRDNETLTIWQGNEVSYSKTLHKELAQDDIWKEKWDKLKHDAESREAITQVPPTPDERPLWECLKRARTAAEVRRAYSRSKHWLLKNEDCRKEFRDSAGNLKGFQFFPPPTYPLYDHAEEFCKAKLDPRYPRGDSVRSDDTRIEYLARVLAGLSLWKPKKPSYSEKILRGYHRSAHR